MTTITQTQTSPWDLTHLVSFLPAHAESSSEKDDNIAIHEALSSTLENSQRNDGSTTLADGLGDFSKVWQFLGTRVDDPCVLGSVPAKDDYASDGATYPIPGSMRHHRSSHNPTDGTRDVDSAFVGTNMQASDSDGRQQKKSRKKARRQEKKAALAPRRATLSETECDSSFGRETPASKASSHGMTTRSMSAKMQIKHNTSNTPASKADTGADAGLKEDIEEVPDTPCPRRDSAQVLNLPTKPLSERVHATYASQHLPAAKSVHLQAPPSIPQTTSRQQSTTPNIYKSNNLVPSSLQPSLHGKPVNLARQMTTPQPAKKAVSPPNIQPLILRTGEDRDLALYMKLIRNFGSDLAHLVKPMSMINHSSDPSGLHCFIDFSNIAIGFVEQLKRSRNIHPMQRIPDVNLSFDSLALLIERRRPVAKRVLVGSNPHNVAFDKAKAVGYEVSILEKVYKARELTERQIYFQEADARRSGRKSSTKAPPHKIALQGSVLTPGGPEMINPTEPVYAPPRYVEQGVDEILHLKMMESILDAEKPSTMVLATGDANCGEYSSGFIAMVERALRKGWKVELTSWSKNTSSMYKHQAWTAAWGERFRIIELDDYAEELLEL